MTCQPAADKLPVAWMKKVEIIETPSEEEGTQAAAVPVHRHTAAVPSNCCTNTLAAVKLTSNGFSVPQKDYFDRYHIPCHLLIVTRHNSKSKMSCNMIMVASCWRAGSFDYDLRRNTNQKRASNIRSPKKKKKNTACCKFNKLHYNIYIF